MAKQTEQDMHDLKIYGFITNLITLKVMLEDIDKFSKVIDLKISDNIKQ